MRKTSANTDGSSSSIKLILTPGVAGLREKHVKSIIWRKDFKILVENGIKTSMDTSLHFTCSIKEEEITQIEEHSI